jgi:hypothetical protein
MTGRILVSQQCCRVDLVPVTESFVERGWEEKEKQKSHRPGDDSRAGVEIILFNHRHFPAQHRQHRYDDQEFKIAIQGFTRAWVGAVDLRCGHDTIRLLTYLTTVIGHSSKHIDIITIFFFLPHPWYIHRSPSSSSSSSCALITRVIPLLLLLLLLLLLELMQLVVVLLPMLDLVVL